jgi:hypothetical protein
MKQETLEEAVNNFKKTDVYINEIKQEQDKKLYSEEDMRGMYDKSCGLIGLGFLYDQTENNSRFNELLEQFKNK